MNYSTLKRRVESGLRKATKSDFPDWAQVLIERKLSKGAFCREISKNRNERKASRESAYRRALGELIAALDVLVCHAHYKK